MSKDNFTIDFGIIFVAIMLGVFLGAVGGTVTERSATEQKTVVYCVEQPSACKVKYDFYKLENQK